MPVKRIAVVLMLAVVVLLGATACAPAAPSAADTKAACFANEALIQDEMKLFYEDSNMYPPISDVVDKMHLKCPSGGTYSFDPNTGIVTCSVHGHP